MANSAIKKVFYSALLVLGLSACSHIQNPASTKEASDSNTTTSKKESLLFVISANKARVVDVSKNTRRVYLDNPKIIYFTDRPIRDVGTISLDQFLCLWSQGKNSFQKDNPNTFAVARMRNGEERTSPAIMTDPQRVKNGMSFEAVLLRGKQFETGDITGFNLFIDPSTPPPMDIFPERPPFFFHAGHGHGR